ncbi:sulfotransferase family protein [Sphingobium yanoikuyae]|uniref:Sulfotransferase family protein n=1 Tax=Sphingobium yanoikuyae TaxID=13690 RepID=A0A291MZY0_SPHYA|nr:sulfotransferase [Sphingobium yanoikuyae]ATI80662.1 sulfotransferase family protein [Sphingobium yanoikuyae]
MTTQEAVRSDHLLTPEAMLAASTSRTGLSDFGSSSFREGLDLLLSDIRALDLGPAYVRASAWRIGQSLDTRALAVQGLKARPELLSRPIREPVIIAGLVRSGTTALHLLMSLDPQFQGPEHWLTVYPMPRPPRETWDAIVQYQSEKATMEAFLATSPEAADDHMMTAEGIEESLFILGSSFSSNMWPSMWQVPQYDRWYRGRDDTDSYRWLADVLRLIGAGDERRWLLKNPTDLFSLHEVLNVFPDAKVIQTHRDPVDSMPSVSNLIFSARRAFCGDKAGRADVGRREAELWADALERAEAVRAKSDNAFVDVEFGDFTRDQMGVIRSIYDQFDLTLAPETEAAMQAWLDAHPRRTSKGPKHVPEDFGLTRQGLEEKFAAYRKRRGYM